MILPVDTVLVKEQSVWATAETSGFFSMPITDGTANINQVMYTSERGRVSNVKSIPIKGEYHYTFTLNAELEPSHLPFFLKNLCGNYAFSADDPEATANTHTIKYASSVADINQIMNLGFTMEFGSTSKYYTLDSCIVTAIDIAPPERGLIAVTIEGMAREKAEDTTSAGSYSVNSPNEIINTFQNVIKSGVDASEVTQPTVNHSLHLERGVEPQFIQSSQTVQQWTLLPNSVVVSGSFEIQYNDTERAAVLDDFNNGDEVSIQYIGTSAVIITAAYKSITFDIPEAKFMNIEFRNDGKHRYESYQWEAGLESGTDITTITVVNTEATL